MSVSISPPRFLFMELYVSCNLRCRHCDFWKRPNTLGQHGTWSYLRHLAQRTAIVAEFAGLNSRGVVVTHGGETMLDWSDYLDFSTVCRQKGLKLLSVTNGTPISSVERAERLVEGPAEVSVSFDSMRPEIHDSFRGIAGSFDKARRAVDLLLEARAKLGSKIKVHAMLLLGKSTYRDLEYSYDFAFGELGVDKLKLNAIQPSFGVRADRDEFFAAESDVDPDELRKNLMVADHNYNLDFSPKWLDQVVMYFGSVRANPTAKLGWSADPLTSDHICNSYDRNVWVSNGGLMQLCCDARWTGSQWWKTGDLAKFWEEAGPQREQMACCNRLCGISHSLRSASSTLGATPHGK